ncbi:hypothetical protein JTE90_013494 [Oedothorax gibbosus]|uniref:Uncharacterized protein n=1 Tax=Oedothorax gibbosus TaxID=931172 RepID=A0AAV6VMB4_9ARAC|nr:hypothetical protein JTE90_013494 [Oedothorax gibbosus]
MTIHESDDLITSSFYNFFLRALSTDSNLYCNSLVLKSSSRKSSFYLLPGFQSLMPLDDHIILGHSSPLCLSVSLSILQDSNPFDASRVGITSSTVGFQDSNPKLPQYLDLE